MNIDNASVILSKKYARAFLHSNAPSITYDDIKHIETLGASLKNDQFPVALLKISQSTDTSQKEALILLYPLVDLLVQSNRIFLLTTICHWIGIYFRQKNHIIQFLITSPHPLSLPDKEKIHQFLTTKTHALVETLYATDPSLIAGLRIQSTTYLWEKSIAQQLRAVQIKMQ